VVPPPVPPSPAPSEEPAFPARWRAAIAFLVLATYVTVPALLGLGGEDGGKALLPGSVRGVLLLCGIELGLFGLAFGLAWLLARLRARELLLTTPLRWWAWPRAH